MAYGFTSPYYAEIPGGTVARCNPVNAPASCRSSVLDEAGRTAPPLTLDPGATTSTPDTTGTTGTSGPATSSPTTSPGTPHGGAPVYPARPAPPVSGRPNYTG